MPIFTPAFPAPVALYSPQSMRLTCAFADADTGTAYDPGAVSLRLRSPSGVITVYGSGSTPPVTKIATGTYQCLVTLDGAGSWHWRFEATGPLSAASEGVIELLPSRLMA